MGIALLKENPVNWLGYAQNEETQPEKNQLGQDNWPWKFLL